MTLEKCLIIYVLWASLSLCRWRGLGGPSSINAAISYKPDKDCRIENARPETQTRREDTPVRKQGSIHLHYCFDTGFPAGPYGDIYFIFVQSTKNSWLGMSQGLAK